MQSLKTPEAERWNGSTPEILETGKLYKNTKFRTQLATVDHIFSQSPKTMLQVSIESGILRANICRYVSTLRKYGNIHLVKVGICPISKHRAGFYTTELEIWGAGNE